MSKQQVNAGGRSTRTANQGAPPYNGNHVDLLIDYRNWTGLESYVSTYLKTPWSPMRVHPMLYLHIRRTWILDLISQDQVEEAASVFDGVRSTFVELLGAGSSSGLKYCIPDELATEMAFIQQCLDDRTCHNHKHSAVGMIKMLVSDYMRLYVPHQLGIDMGDFSNVSFKSTDVRKIIKHIEEECTGPKTQYVMEHVASLRVDGETSRRKRARTSGAEADPTESLATILDKIRTEVSKVETIATDVAEKSAQTCGALKNVKELLTAAEAAARESAAGAPPPAGISIKYPFVGDSSQELYDELDEKLWNQRTKDGTCSLFEAYFHPS